MGNVVAVQTGSDKQSCFDALLRLSGFDDEIVRACDASQKPKSEFRIVIKPNIMVFVHQQDYQACITDVELVERLVDHLIALGFEKIAICEAQNDVGRMLRNHNVAFVAEHAGYCPKGRYNIVDLTTEGVAYEFEYRKGDRIHTWKDQVGRTWMNADFRISFAKLKTHEHDWLTLTTKNVYGAFPPADKVARYHIRSEVFDATARLIRAFPIHFAFLDGWVASDGFQGYKIAHPQPLRMMLAGRDCMAVDMEAFRRAGLDPKQSKMIRAVVAQCSGGEYPAYEVVGDSSVQFRDTCPEWENISNATVEAIDVLEEVYVTWGIINLRPIAMAVDYKMFPPKNCFYRLLVRLLQKVYCFISWISKGWRRLRGEREAHA